MSTLWDFFSELNMKSIHTHMRGKKELFCHQTTGINASIVLKRDSFLLVVKNSCQILFKLDVT